MIKQFQDCYSLLDARARGQYALLGLMMLIGAGLETLSVGLVLPFLQLIEDPARAQAIPVVNSLVAGIGDIEQGRLLIYAGLGFLAVVAMKNAFLVVLVYCQYRIAYHNEWLLSTRLFWRYLESPFAHTMRRNSAELIRNVKDAVGITTGNVFLGFITVFTEFFVIAAIGALLMALQPLAGLSALAVLGIGAGAYHLLVRQRFTAWGERALSLRKDQLQSLQQGLHSLKTTKVHGREGYFRDSFSAVTDILARLGAVINTANNTPRLWVETVFVASVLVMIVILVPGGTGEAGVLPVLGLFAAAAFRLMPSVNRMIIAFNNIKHGAAALESVVGDIHAEFTETTPRTIAGDETELGSIRSISLDGVSFTYPESSESAIDGISLDIAPGKSLGLVGPSGSGKTTMVDILLGLLTPSKGRVLVNGENLSEVLGPWRGRVGYVPQTVYILDDSLRRNIAFGFADDEIRDDDVRTAIRLAHLDDFVDSLPDGLDTNLGEHGARLSGGQQQRVGIARALYHNPDILVLDEATSSLDSETEHAITAAMETLRGVKTVIVIAHRLSTVKRCDHLVFLEGGRIGDTGTFDDLTARNAMFRNLVELAKL